MKKIKCFTYVFLLITTTLISCKKDNSAHSEKKEVASTVLPSWNEGATKTAIINFVSRITDKNSADYVMPQDRIATFDNDGTLWCEKPLIQELFVFYLIKKEVDKHPELKDKQPYKAIVNNDSVYLKSLKQEDLISLVINTHTGMIAEDFAANAADFFDTAKTPSGISISKLVYQPQLELLDYLRQNGFKIYICSGGTTDFIRAISQKYYNIPPEQVIGSQFKTVYQDSSNKILRIAEISTYNDKQVKPVNIWSHIGKRPILTCGNEGAGGDIYMLRFSQGGNKPSLQLLVNHDDAMREVYYQEKDNKSLDWAKKYKWQVISIKNDWNKVYTTK